jgi:beta-glucanase (GH16 family)
LQYYTERLENCRIEDGNLIITAIKEEKEGFQYTSARIKTMGKFEFQYGKVEMRAKLPQGMGIWPAFWMLGADIEVNPWPQCGEIDIMEHIGRLPGVIHGTLHGPEYSGNMGIGKSIESETSIYDNYHTYAIEWDRDFIRWYFDDVQYHQVVREKLPTTYTWVYDKDFFLLLNLAVGGNWPGNPNDTTVFPQTYTIDYVRVYR